MQVYDLSQQLEAGMPCYPGTPDPRFQPISTIESNGFSEQLLTVSSHTGTHIDLPSHILEGAPSLDTFDINSFFGNGLVLDVRNTRDGLITVDMLKPFHADIAECDFLLLCSGMSNVWGTSSYFEHYPTLSMEAAQWLASCPLKGVGVDMISVDAPDATDFPVHQILLQQELIIVENLANLFSLLHHTFLFCCFPLKLSQGEASPVRAVALVDDNKTFS